MTGPYAHSGGHALDAHLRGVAALAERFAREFGASGPQDAGTGWAYIAGLWHDLGKYRAGFQRYLAQSDDPNAHIEGRVAGRDKTHSAAGALWAIERLEATHGAQGKLAARVLAYLIAGHHAGLADWDGGLKERLAQADSLAELRDALAGSPPADILHPPGFTPSLHQIPGGSAGFSLWVRMLFSCLVDADFLDTEAHFNAALPARRAGFPSLAQMQQAFDAHMAATQADAPDTPVNRLRAQVLDQCHGKAALAPGFFSLSVPTGGGKTLSSLGFALRHAGLHGQQRIVYAIPYTSIIEQTADVFRRVFRALGEEALVEHHSQAEGRADGEDETARSRLASENWDAPLIVTTNVQLFESLFAARTSRCRKLHNLVGSVIVLDEAQQLPPAFLQPILDMLNLLVHHYGVSVVLCTATQPALSTTAYFDASQNLRGLDNVREIIDHPDVLYAALQRVRVQLPADWQASMAWPEVAQALAQEDCVLAIVNTRKGARELHALMPPGTLHLSALMCGAHRSAVIGQIRQRLQARRDEHDTAPLRVVSTQLVEAGVDLDFPVVWRALAGLDSIAQAAGRCNREGLLAEGGRVVVFVPPQLPPPGLLREAAQACRSVLHGFEGDPLTDRSRMHAYFKDLYARDLDAKRIVALLKMNVADDSKAHEAVAGGRLDAGLMSKALERLGSSLNVAFGTAANLFRLIEDENSALVVVRYGPAQEEIEDCLTVLASEGPQRRLLRKLQRYTVTIHEREALQMLKQGDLTLPYPGLYVQKLADGIYDESLGLFTDGVLFRPGGLVG